MQPRVPVHCSAFARAAPIRRSCGNWRYTASQSLQYTIASGSRSYNRRKVSALRSPTAKSTQRPPSFSAAAVPSYRLSHEAAHQAGNFGSLPPPPSRATGSPTVPPPYSAISPKLIASHRPLCARSNPATCLGRGRSPTSPLRRCPPSPARPIPNPKIRQNSRQNDDTGPLPPPKPVRHTPSMSGGKEIRFCQSQKGR